MAIRRNPLFQNALLRRQSQAVASGRAVTDTSDISATASGRQAQMQSAFKDIALHQKGRKENRRQFKKNLRLERKRIDDAKSELPWRIGLGLGTTALAGWQGLENRKALRRQTNEQQLRTSELNSKIEELILMNELAMGIATPGFLMRGDEQ